MIINKDYLKNIVNNNSYNDIIFNYYDLLAKDVNSDKEAMSIYFKMDRLRECNKTWILDKYDVHKIKDFKRTYLCKDRFCANCRKVKQAVRMRKFMDLLQKYDDDLYFFTFTVPNCSGDDLHDTIEKMYKAFSKLLRYMNGEKKIKNIDLSMFNYQGCIRNLEVTFHNIGIEYNEYDKRFHPHIHCAFVLKNYVPTKEYLKNKFSVDKYGRRDLRLFTRENIIVQKIWKLCYDGKIVNEKNINNLKLGYSVIIDKFKPGQYGEMFKYMIKEKDLENKYMDYKTFKVLYYKLQNVRQLAGYGIFYNVKDSLNDEFIQNEVNEIYFNFIKCLRKKEEPLEVHENPEEIMNNDDYIIITKKRIYGYLKKCMIDDFKNSNLIDLKVSIDYNKINSMVDELVNSDLKKYNELRVSNGDKVIKNIDDYSYIDYGKLNDEVKKIEDFLKRI